MARHKLNERVNVTRVTVVHHFITTEQLEPITAKESKQLSTREANYRDTQNIRWISSNSLLSTELRLLCAVHLQSCTDHKHKHMHNQCSLVCQYPGNDHRVTNSIG